MTLSEVLESYGISMGEQQALEKFDRALSVVVGRDAATPLAADEAAIYDAADFGEDPAALHRQTENLGIDFAALVASALTVAAAALRVGVSRPRMQQLVSARSVWAIEWESKWVLPAIQFDGDGLLPGWAKVAQAIPDGMHPLEVLGFLTTPQPELVLGGRPRSVVDWLRSGGATADAVEVTRGLDSVGL